MELAKFSGSLIETPDQNYSLLMKNFFPVVFPSNGADKLSTGTTYMVRILNQTREILGLPMDTFRGQLQEKTTYSLIEGTGNKLIDPLFLMIFSGMTLENFKKVYLETYKSVLIDICIFLRK